MEQVRPLRDSPPQGDGPARTIADVTVELSIACAIHDQRIAETYLLPSLEALDGDPPDRFLLDNGGNAVSHSMAHLCNMLARLQGPSGRIILHPDVRFPPDFTRRVAMAIARLDELGVRWGALGTVGRSWQGAYSGDTRSPRPPRSARSTRAAS